MPRGDVTMRIGLTDPRTVIGVTLAVCAATSGAATVPTIIAHGRVTFDTARAVPVGSPASGRVVRVMVRPGDAVAEGTPLVVISSDLASALSDELGAEADAAAAEGAFQRQRQLYRVRAETEGEFDAARAARRAARADLERAERNVNLLEVSGRRNEPIETTLRSPVAGRVLEIAVHRGGDVHRGRAGAPARAVLTVGEVKNVEVVAVVAARDLRFFRGGEPVGVRELGHPEWTLAGRVARVSPAVDPITCTARVWCDVADPDARLRPGASATVVLAETVPGRQRLPGSPRE